jgi:hypothetical protein
MNQPCEKITKPRMHLNLAPRSVTRNVVPTPWGTLRGGNVPLILARPASGLENPTNYAEFQTENSPFTVFASAQKGCQVSFISPDRLIWETDSE